MTIICAFTNFVAVLCLLCCLVWIVCATWLNLLDAAERKREQRDRRAVDAGMRKLARLMGQQSYWFSESTEAQTVISVISAYVLMHDCFDVDQIRDKWREKTGKDGSE